MCSIKYLDTLSLKQLYYLLSIDLWSILSHSVDPEGVNGEALSRDLHLSAVEYFGINMDEDEIASLFIQPLITYLDFSVILGDGPAHGQYALSIHHFEFDSSLKLFLAGISR